MTRSLSSEVREALAQVGELFRVSRREKLDSRRGDGREHPDPTPVELPVGYTAPLTVQEMVQQYIRQEVSSQAAQVGLGTFDEENDFEPEDPEEVPLSGYEVIEYEFTEEPGSPLQDEVQPADQGGEAAPPAADSRIPGAEGAPSGEAAPEAEPPPAGAAPQ